MAQSANAAYCTVPKDYRLRTVQAHFLTAAEARSPLAFKVQRSSDGKRFAVRHIEIEQNSTIVAVVTTSFISGQAWRGPSMTHAVSPTIERSASTGVRDSAKKVTAGPGPFLQFERLAPLTPGQFSPVYPATCYTSVKHLHQVPRSIQPP